MHIIQTDKSPKAIGPYSQAVEHGGLVFCSGMLGLAPETMHLAQGVEAQTRQVFQNLRNLLAAAGASLDTVLKTTVFLKSMDDFAAMNAIYAEEFDGHAPARTTIQAGKLPLDACVEIECVAAVK